MAKRILIVVDEAAMAKWLPRHFEAQGASVIQTAVDEEAIAEARTNPDVVILDLVLADRDGFVLIQEIRAAAPDTFLICTSARIGGVARRKALAIGADAYLAKPLALDELDQLVNSDLAIRSGDNSEQDDIASSKGNQA